MYVWGRLGRMLATAKRRGPFRLGDDGRLSFRCLPTDIDRNIHLNNARYMMLADVGRIDIFYRSGLFQLWRRRGWTPMMGGVQTAFLREIRLWKRFDIVTTIETWDETQMIGRHRFTLEDGRTAAIILTTVGVYNGAEKRFMPISEMLGDLGYDGTPPRPLTDMEMSFLASHRKLRSLARSAAKPEEPSPAREKSERDDGMKRAG